MRPTNKNFSQPKTFWAPNAYNTIVSDYNRKTIFLQWHTATITCEQSRQAVITNK